VIRFGRHGVQVEPLNLPQATVQTLERRLLLFFTGASRNSSSILRHQEAATRQQDAVTLRSLHQIKAMATDTIELLQAGELNRYGALLHESWETKKRLTDGISNAEIGRWYDLARAHGALGGKVTGAGGGGFLLLYCDETAQDAVTSALEHCGVVRMDFRFDEGGAVVLMDTLPPAAHLFRPRPTPTTLSDGA
jgi:D-glycero-alpha-D-manno-heptose-7-phosphate kinase